jgi:hypothetical protein
MGVLAHGIAVVMRKNTNEYKKSKTDVRKRKNRRELEKNLNDANKLLIEANKVQTSVRSDAKSLAYVNEMAKKAREVSQTLGKTPPTAVSTWLAGPKASTKKPQATAASRPRPRPLTPSRATQSGQRGVARPPAPGTTASPTSAASYPYQTQQDAYMNALPQLQSGNAQAAMDRLIQQRDQLLQAVANGQTTAAQAETTLTNALNSGEGSAIVAQDPTAATAWLQDASNALYETESSNVQAQQQASYQQQSVEYVYEDGTPAQSPGGEYASDDTDEMIQSEYESSYGEGEQEMEGAMLGAADSTIVVGAGASLLFLTAELGMYKRAGTAFLKRQHRRKLVEGLKRSESLLKQAADGNILKTGVIVRLASKDRETRKAVGVPVLVLQSRAAKDKRAREAQAARERKQQQRVARLQAQVARARAQHVPHDRAITGLPGVQSPAMRAATQNLIQRRDMLQQQILAGATTATQAKGELDLMLTSSEGSAVAAQGQAEVAAWRQASAESMDAAEGAKAEADVAEETATVEEAAAEAVAVTPPARGSMLPVLLGTAIGAGGGYAVAGTKGEQKTYAAIGGVVGLLTGLVIGKILKKRAERRAAAAPATSGGSRSTAVQAMISRLPTMPSALRRMLTEGSFQAGTEGMRYGDGTAVSPADEAAINQYVTSLNTEQQELYGRIISGNL